MSGSSGSRYQNQFRRKNTKKFKDLYKGLDLKFWQGFNQQRSSYWRLNPAMDPISRAIFVREKYAGGLTATLPDNKMYEYFNFPVERLIGLVPESKKVAFKLKCVRKPEISERQYQNYFLVQEEEQLMLTAREYDNSRNTVAFHGRSASQNGPVN